MAMASGPLGVDTEHIEKAVILRGLQPQDSGKYELLSQEHVDWVDLFTDGEALKT